MIDGHTLWQSLRHSITLTFRHTQTHSQIDTATYAVQCSRAEQLELLNGRLATNWVSDCLFDSIPYKNYLIEYVVYSFNLSP